MSTLPSEVRIGPPPASEIAGAVKAMEYAATITVSDQMTYELAAMELQSIKGRAQRIEDARVRMKAPVLEAARQIDSFFAGALVPLQKAEQLVKGVMNAYADEQERLAAEARRKAEEEVRRARAEAERKAKEEREKAAAEAQRQQEESRRAQREADEKARLAREARDRGDREQAAELERQRKTAEDEQRKAQAAAEKAVDKGEEKAQAAMTHAAEVAARPVETVAAPTAAGTSRRSRWKHRVVDFKKLVDAVSSGALPLATLLPDDKVLARSATSLKGEMPNFYPGVEVTEERDLAASTRS